MSGLTILFDNQDRYQDVYCNGFSRIAMKDVVLKEVSQYFDDNVMKKMIDAFPADDQFNLLGVGVGEGHHELHFLKSLGSHFTSIRNVAVEPNQTLFETFKTNAAAWSSDDKSNHDSRWFTGPLSQFFSESPLAKCKYNLISAIHSMYHTGDLETTFTRLMSMLKDNGIMIIVLSECKLMKETFLQNTWLPLSSRINIESLTEGISKVSEQKGYTVSTRKLDIKFDLTDLFDEESELGDRLADFITCTAYLRKTASAEQLDALMSFWRSLCSQEEDGRMRTLSPESIMVISK